MTQVTSSNIKALGHDNRGLFVEFRGGGTYRYEGVPAELYQEGLAAESVGRWLRSDVQKGYKGERISVDADAR